MAQSNDPLSFQKETVSNFSVSSQSGPAMPNNPNNPDLPENISANCCFYPGFTGHLAWAGATLAKIKAYDFPSPCDAECGDLLTHISWG